MASAPAIHRSEIKSLAYHLRRLADVAASSQRKSAPLIVKKALYALEKVLARHGIEEE